MSLEFRKPIKIFSMLIYALKLGWSQRFSVDGRHYQIECLKIDSSICVLRVTENDGVPVPTTNLNKSCKGSSISWYFDRLWDENVKLFFARHCFVESCKTCNVQFGIMLPTTSRLTIWLSVMYPIDCLYRKKSLTHISVMILRFFFRIRHPKFYYEYLILVSFQGNHSIA